MYAGRRWACAGVVGLLVTAILAGNSPRAGAEALSDAPGIQISAFLQERLGASPEWEALQSLSPGDPALLTAVEAALDTWVRQRQPHADGLTLVGLLPYLAIRTLVEAGIWPAGVLREAVKVQEDLLAIYSHFGLQAFPLLPVPLLSRVPLAAYAARSFLYWAALHGELQLMGKDDLWGVLRSDRTGEYSRRATAVPAGGAALGTAGPETPPLEPPVIDRDDRAAVPVRAVSTALGASVDYDPATDRITLRLGDRELVVRPGSRLATFRTPAGSRRVLLPAPAAVQNGRATVALRPLAEALGAAVTAAGEGRTRLHPGVGPAFPAGTLPPPNGRVAHLTLDDGPSAEITPGVLNVLAEYEVRATFFVVGQHAAQYPYLVRQMAAAGHGIGSHSWDHDYRNVYTSPGTLVQSLADAAGAVTAITGHPVRLARAPGGTGTVALSQRPDAGSFWAEVAKAGFRLYDWNVDSMDSRRPRPEVAQLLQNVRDGVKRTGPGDVVILFHDSATHENTLSALPQVIEWLLMEGFALESLPAGD